MAGRYAVPPSLRFCNGGRGSKEGSLIEECFLTGVGIFAAVKLALLYSHVTKWSSGQRYTPNKRWVVGLNLADFIFGLCERACWRHYE